MIHYALILLVIYGVVIDSADNGGSIFLNNEQGKLITPSPSNSMLTDALKSGGNLVGLFQSVDSKGHPYFIERFNTSYQSCVLEYYVKHEFDGKPVKIAIYASKNLTDWVLLKEDVATVGWHKVAIPRDFGNQFYIKFEATSPYSDVFGASFIDEVRIVEGKLSFFDKFDFASGSVMIAGMWVPFTWFAILFLASLIGANTLTSGNNALASAIVAFAGPLILYLIFDLNIFIFTLIYRSPFVLVINFLFFGVIFGFLFSKIFDKRSKYAKD